MTFLSPDTTPLGAKIVRSLMRQAETDLAARNRAIAARAALNASIARKALASVPAYVPPKPTAPVRSPASTKATRNEQFRREAETAIAFVIACEAIAGARHRQAVDAAKAAQTAWPRFRRVTGRVIKSAVCFCYQVSEIDLISERTGKSLTRPRHVAMYLMKEMTTMSFPRIGAKFGGRDHTTVMHACRKISAIAATDVGFQKLLDDLKAAILREVKS